MFRIMLFLATNFAILLVLGFFLNVILPAFGIHLSGNASLLAFAAVLGIGGAFVSLLLSKWLAIRSTGAKVIEQPRSESEVWLVDTVSRFARDARIGMPQVAIFDSPQPNAFATGANRNKALVAVSTGLLHNMSKSEVEAVVGHEISHVANGDMITMTLVQGVLNTFVIFFARIIGRIIDNALSRGESNGFGFGYFMAVMVAEIVLGILASIIVMWFSRWREFRADAGGANLAGRSNMISALKRLQSLQNQESDLPGELAAFGIRGKSAFSKLFMSHPPLTARIERLSQY